MTDVEIINTLCEMDNVLRQHKRNSEAITAMIRTKGITELPPHLAAMAPQVLDSARKMLAAKRELRLKLWNEYGIFYYSEI